MNRATIVGLLALFLLCACGNDPDPDAYPPTRLPVGNLVGTLDADSHCFYLDDARGARHVLVFARHVATVKGQSLVYQGTIFRVGDHMEVFGGATPQASKGDTIVAVDISACDPEAKLWIVR